MRRNDLGELDRTCIFCGEVFFYDVKPGNSPDYCSNACKQAAYRKRHRKHTAVTIKTRLNIEEQSLTLTLNGGHYLLGVDDITDLLEKLIKAKNLLTAQQKRF